MADFPFEIIEIGAVKLDEDFQMVDEFHRLIRPQVYRQMHYMISEVTHMNMEELNAQGMEFSLAAEEFLDWCGENPVFCTWGSMDLTELQRNMAYYNMERPFPFPLLYYDVQKLYGLFVAEGARMSLDGAVEQQGLLEKRPFHRALDDAYYTGRVLACLAEKMDLETLLVFQSVDYYQLPANRKEEIYLTFPGYSKYVSQVFDSREEAMKDRNVVSMKCYECGKSLRKKIRWFTVNQKMYFALAVCPEHGYLKGKIRMKKADGDRVFVVKTLKLTDEDGAAFVANKKEELRKKRAERNKAKRLRQREEAAKVKEIKKKKRKNKK